MSEGVIAEEEWASGLAAVVPSPERNPVGVYLARLAPGSRRAMRQALGHLAALARHGPCPSHRRSFAPVAQSVLGF